MFPLDLAVDDFEVLRKIAHERTGIALSENKRALLYGRLIRRLRALEIESFKGYIKFLRSGDKSELSEFQDVITTNLTSFFREQHHFDYIKSTIVPQLLARSSQERTLRIWSAGCSSGMEPYSILMSLLGAAPEMARWDIQLTASDLDSKTLAIGERGVYRLSDIKSLDTQTRNRWFQKGSGDNADLVKVKRELSQRIRFRQSNLMQHFSFAHPFDIIFCRNVIIYFDRQTQTSLFEKIASQQVSGAWLFVGHSESLNGITERYKLLGQTIYTRL